MNLELSEKARKCRGGPFGTGWRRNVLSAHCSGVLPMAKLRHNVTWSFRKAETPQSGAAGLRSRQAPRYIFKGVFSFSEHKLRIAAPSHVAIAK
jgi:hypothetical protein